MKTPIKVCLLTKNFGRQGGLEKYARHLAFAFARKGASVTVLTGEKVPGKLHDNIRVTRLPISGIFSFQKLLRFDKAVTRHLETNTYDCVLGLDRNTHQTHIRAGNGVHKAYLAQRAHIEPKWRHKLHKYNPLHRTILYLEKKGFESTSLKTCFTNSYMVRGEIMRFYNTPPENIEVIHNGMEWHTLERPFNEWMTRKNTIAQKLNLNPNEYQFLFVGHGYKRKGLLPLLSGLALIKDKAFHLSVVGKDKKLNWFKKKVVQLGLQDKVTFFGAQDDIHPFYQIADCLVIPSYYDPFANVTVEALAMGLYVVSSRHNGGYEVLKKESGTAIVSLKHPCLVARSLEWALLHPKTWLSSCTIRDSVKHLDFSTQLNRIVNRCYDQI